MPDQRGPYLSSTLKFSQNFPVPVNFFWHFYQKSARAVMKRALTISHRQSSSPPEKLIPQRRRDPADLRDPPLMGHKMMINIAIMARTSHVGDDDFKSCFNSALYI